MENTVPQPTPEVLKMTPEQAEAYAIVLKEIKPFFDSHQAHVERVNEQGRVAARPVYLIAGGIAAAVATAALWAAIAAHDDQLARDLMFPLLSFAGGLGLGRSSSPSK